MSLPLIDADRSVLLVIDIQTRLIASMAATARAQIRCHVARLAQAADSLGVPVLVSRQYPKGLGDTDPEVRQALPDGAYTVDKTCFATSDHVDFQERLRMTGRDQIVLCGMEAHVCVLQTAAGLASGNYHPVVVTDAVCSRNPAHAEDALARLRNAGIAVANHESVLFEWLRDASHPEFKSVSALLK